MISLLDKSDIKLVFFPVFYRQHFFPFKIITFPGFLSKDILRKKNLDNNWTTFFRFQNSLLLLDLHIIAFIFIARIIYKAIHILWKEVLPLIKFSNIQGWWADAAYTLFNTVFYNCSLISSSHIFSKQL